MVDVIVDTIAGERNGNRASFKSVLFLDELSKCVFGRAWGGFIDGCVDGLHRGKV